MNIFDNIERTDTGVPLPGEGQFAYLNRSARTDAAREFAKSRGVVRKLSRNVSRRPNCSFQVDH